MPPFVSVSSGWINLDHVALVEFTALDELILHFAVSTAQWMNASGGNSKDRKVGVSPLTRKYSGDDKAAILERLSRGAV